MPASTCRLARIGPSIGILSLGQINGKETKMTEPERFIAENRERVALVINLRGGKDSTRMLGYLRERFPDVATYCVMADTGFEHVRPVSAVDWSRTIACRFGLDVQIVC